jgi:hypothetical protein
MCNPGNAYYVRCISKMVAASPIGLELSCTQSYSPPATRGGNNFLVVDGFINTGSDSTIFNLSNSVNLGNTTAPVPETGAQIIVEGSGGFSSPLVELGKQRTKEIKKIL